MAGTAEPVASLLRVSLKTMMFLFIIFGMLRDKDYRVNVTYLASQRAK